MMTEPAFTLSDDRRQLEARAGFDHDAPLTLTASNASGRIEIRTDASLPGGTVVVTATRTDNGTFEADDHHFSVKIEDNSIAVHPDWQFASGVSGLARRIRDQLQHGFKPEDWNLSRLRLSPELDFDIAIRLPQGIAEGSQLRVRTASGAVRAHDLTAGVSIVTASGDVHAHQLTGTVAIHTASGDVEASEILESLEINTASGDIDISGGDAWLAARSASGDVEIRDLSPRNGRITTVSGDVTLRAPLTNTGAPYGIETVSGDVRLDATLPADGTRATLGFGTLSGSSSVSGAWEQQKRREWSAGTGDRAVTINVKTVSGDLSASATLSGDVTARTIDLPQGTAAEADSAADFKDEMREFGREMKTFGQEIRRAVDAERDAPTPPTPPTPPRAPEAPAGRGGDHLFTAGPAGRAAEQRDTSQATEPVAAPEPFADEPDAPAASAGDTAPVAAPTEEPTSAPEQDERLQLLEAVERGELTIEEALAHLNAGDTSR